MDKKIILISVVFFLLLAGAVLALDFDPKGNINMKNRYGIYNMSYWINGSFNIYGNVNMSNYNITDLDWLYVHNISGWDSADVFFASDIDMQENNIFDVIWVNTTNLNATTIYTTWLYTVYGNLTSLNATNIYAININTTVINTTDLRATNLESNLDATGYNITALEWLNVTNLEALNLEQNLDATGFNITALSWLNVTNLQADNLERNLDATGFNITAINEVAATLIDTTNLEADNLESNIDATGYNITALEWLTVTNLNATNLESNLDGTGFALTINDVYAIGINTTVLNTTDLRATNLEANLDATGYNITALDWLTVTNLNATNLESDLDGTGFTLTIGNVIGATDVNTTNVYTNFLNATTINTTTLNTGAVTVTGNLNMSGNNITNVDWLYVHNISGWDSADVFFASDIDMSTNSIVDATDVNTTNLYATKVDVTNLLATNLERNLDATGYNITAINEVAATLIDTTNLEADNLESNIDATGYNITALDWLTVTNLNATNLEADLDGTGYTLTIGNVIGATWVNSTNVDTDNLYADNLESNLDGTGYNITAANFSCTNCLGEEQIQDIYVLTAGDTITGSLIIDGNLTILGDYVNATVTNQYLNGSFLPSLNNTFDIGSIAAQWATGYFNTLNVTNLGGFSTINLESNMDATGYNISNVDWLSVTNLQANNLEDNLDGTGYKLTIGNIVGVTDVNTTDVHATNLYGAGAGITGVLFDTGDTASGDYTFTSDAFTILSTQVTGTYPVLLVEGRMTSASAPTIDLYHNSSSPADSDGIGSNYYYGNDNNSNKQEYAQIYVASTDVTDGTEDSYYRIGTQKAGSRVTLSIQGDSITSSTGNLGIGTTSPTEDLHIVGEDILINSSTSGKPTIQMYNVNADSSPGVLYFFKYSASPADHDGIGTIHFYGYDSNLAANLYASIYVNSEDVAAGSEDGSMQFRTAVAGSNAARMTINGSNIGIGTTSPSEMLDLLSSTSAKPVIRMENTNTDSYGARFHFVKDTSDETDDDELGAIFWHGDNNESVETLFARMLVLSSDVSNGTEDARIRFRQMVDGTESYTWEFAEGGHFLPGANRTYNIGSEALQPKEVWGETNNIGELVEGFSMNALEHPEVDDSGIVMCLDETKPPGFVKPCEAAYDGKVIGVSWMRVNVDFSYTENDETQNAKISSACSFNKEANTTTCKYAGERVEIGCVFDNSTKKYSCKQGEGEYPRIEYEHDTKTKTSNIKEYVTRTEHRIDTPEELPRQDDKVRVALLGRYKTWVDCDAHDINIGDMLVSSDTPGYGQYYLTNVPATPLQTSTFLMNRQYGKAMEACKVGDGLKKIEVRLGSG